MPQAPRSARGERTREALRRAAQVRFLAQGVEETSAEQIAADAGVSLRTFYRHYGSKHELLFGDYEASLQWFRAALESRPREESVIAAVLAANQSFPFDPTAMIAVASLRASELDQVQVDRHIHQVQAEFAIEVERFLLRQSVAGTDDARFALLVEARCIAAAVFAAVDTWMRGPHSDLDVLTRLTERALHSLARGVVPGTRTEPGPAAAGEMTNLP
jgi:AcrR family transcriptional regulator